ncbi:hypothetical protein FFR93_02015 [Rhizobium sp. MHM7A]|nr:hypothetical protein FFR93_02015 [Rhizobium sp. MHM7A]
MNDQALTSISPEDLRHIVDGVQVEAEALRQLPEGVILGVRDCWNLKDDDGFGYSTKNMSDEELQMAIVEDLLLIVDWRRDGKELGGNFAHLTRLLGEESRERVAKQLESPMVKSLTVVDAKGNIEIAPGYLQDAMDFAGFWIEGGEFLSAGPIISLAPEYR